MESELNELKMKAKQLEDKLSQKENNKLDKLKEDKRLMEQEFRSQ